MERYTIKTILGSYDYEVITKNGRDYIATISRTAGLRYLKLSEVPKPIVAFLKKSGYRIDLLDADMLNEHLGLC